MPVAMRRILLTKRKHADSGLDFEPVSSSEALESLPKSSGLQSFRQSGNDKTFTLVSGGRVKSEPALSSLPMPMAPTSANLQEAAHAPSSINLQIAMPLGPSVTSMVDTTDYVPTSSRNAAALGRAFTDNSREQSVQRSEDVFTPATSSIVPSQQSRNGGTARQDDAISMSATGPNSPSNKGSPNLASSPLQQRRAPQSRPSTPQRRSTQKIPKAIENPESDKAQSNASRSLYPSPSATGTPHSLTTSSPVKKKPKTARLDDPEPFMYAGNTFSNLDEETFHETAAKNPYLSELTTDASRPVYRSPREARRALKESEKPVAAPLDYDQQIRELTTTIAELRRKYEKAKLMTKQAGIEVAGNVWDRLLNLVQYPPDFNAYAEKGPVDVKKYMEQMKAWDKAIGHQVIIKKRVVYKEAIEMLQTKLDILQAEKDVDSHGLTMRSEAEKKHEDDQELFC